MANKIVSIEDYNFKSEDELLLDTNIWLFVYGPQKPNDKKVDTYSQALSEILTAKCHIYIDVLILSEFINAYARMKWKQIAKNIKPFKKFRNSQAFCQRDCFRCQTHIELLCQNRK